MQNPTYDIISTGENGSLIKYQLNPEDQIKVQQFVEQLFQGKKRPLFKEIKELNPMSFKIHRIPTELQDDVKIFCKKRREQRYTFKSIADFFEKDHSTIMHQVRMYDNLFKYDSAFRKKVEEFKEDDFLTKYNNYRESISGFLTNTEGL